MSLATLFGKLQEHEMELLRLHQNEENDKKKKGIALKASSSIQEELSDYYGGRHRSHRRPHSHRREKEKAQTLRAEFPTKTTFPKKSY